MSIQPTTRPGLRPDLPATRPGLRPDLPATRPGLRPDLPATRPGLRPDLPATRPGLRPDLPITPGRWSVVPASSTVVFTVRELGLVSVHGSFPVVDGTVEVDGSGRPVSVRATLDARGVGTGNRRRDRDLRGPKFLAADRWPTLSFTSREVHRAGPEQPPEEWTAVGTLQVRDVRSPLTLTVRLAGIGPDGARQVVATGTVDRRAAGVRTAPTFVIGSAVRISLDVMLAPPGH